jgi:hypothetical protein
MTSTEHSPSADRHDGGHDHGQQAHSRHDHSRHDHGRHDRGTAGTGLTRMAVSATLHCLTGCAIGEVLGLVLATWWGWSTGPSIALAVVLAFVFGYALTISPVLRAGVPLRQAIRVALAADTLSILTMEIVDNAIVLAVPGAMEAGLASLLFWGSLAVALAVAFVLTVPVNRALIARGRGHAVVHAYHR